MGLTCFKSPFKAYLAKCYHPESCKQQCLSWTLLSAHPLVGWEMMTPELMNSQLIVPLSALHKLFLPLLVGLSEGFEDGEVGKEKYLPTLKIK